MAEVIPTGDKIKVLPLLVADTTRSGRVVIPDAAKGAPREGLVLAVGRGQVLDSGAIVPMEIEVGDVVCFSKYAGIYVYDEDLDLECIFMRDGEVLARKRKADLPAVLPNDPRAAFVTAGVNGE